MLNYTRLRRSEGPPRPTAPVGAGQRCRGWHARPRERVLVLVPPTFHGCRRSRPLNPAARPRVTPPSPQAPSPGLKAQLRGQEGSLGAPLSPNRGDGRHPRSPPAPCRLPHQAPMGGGSPGPRHGQARAGRAPGVGSESASSRKAPGAPAGEGRGRGHRRDPAPAPSRRQRHPEGLGVAQGEWAPTGANPWVLQQGAGRRPSAAPPPRASVSPLQGWQRAVPTPARPKRGFGVHTGGGAARGCGPGGCRSLVGAAAPSPKYLQGSGAGGQGERLGGSLPGRGGNTEHKP